MKNETFRILRQMLMEHLDLSRELTDKEILEQIDELILTGMRDSCLSLKEKVQLRQELFHSVRKLDVLQELIEDETVTEIMVNGAGKIFYERVKNMLDSCSVDFNEMLHRMQSIELYEKSRLEEQQTISLNRVTLVFTVFFGLPLIQETLTTIKTILGAQKDLILKINCGQFSMVIWVVLLMVLLVEEIDRNSEYEGIKIEDDSLIRSRIKKGVLSLLMKIYKNKKS